ncbi:hypothetical protein MNBD_NITROSPINAE02-1066 [hydrothermal vent metagenome]|uniref:DUF4911 domain-containing protein n=1 Tax=hydrothermal vent metagenome TaxID=652676 RepID=A0A3B1C3A8_9ZZZZ
MKDIPNKISFPIPSVRPDSYRMLIRVKPEDMSYVVMIIESYDYIGIARTVNQSEGVMEILVSPDFLDITRAVITALKDEIGLEAIRV